MAGVEDMISEATRSVNNNTHGTPNEITEFYADRNGKDFLDAFWCDMSITFWAFRSGNHEAVCFGTDFALTSAHANRFKEADQFQDGASEIRPGDIAFFPRDGLAIGHVGLVRTVEGDVIKTIEGNTSDAVRHRTHLIAKGMIVGYGRPNYTKELTIVDEATRKFFCNLSVAAPPSRFEGFLFVPVLPRVWVRRPGAGVMVERPQAQPRTNDLDADEGWRMLAAGRAGEPGITSSRHHRLGRCGCGGGGVGRYGRQGRRA